MIEYGEEFHKFISPDCDRATFIQDFLSKKNIESCIIQVEKKNHIYVKFPLNQYNPTFKIKTIIAHYDRVLESPGANDNSAAVFVLMHWAEKLMQMKTPHNIRLIFTDGEESGENGVIEQGAFTLAKLFTRLKITNDDVFVFDCMGRGNIPILCETKISEKIGKKFKSNFFELENRAKNLLAASSAKWLTLPTSYSDNAGFLACGIPAVAFTMLPSNEVENFLYLNMKYPTEKSKQCKEYTYEYKKLYPPTWLMLHTKFDNAENLTKESANIFFRILENLSQLKTVSTHR